MGVIETLNKLFPPKKQDTHKDMRRNDLCWCGSGKKYKQCHLQADEKKRLSSR